MRHERLLQVGALAVAVVLVGAAGYFLKPINAQREAMGMSATIKDINDMPPEIAFSNVALGGFRGLAVDYFWVRAEMLKQEGRLYEANQLAHWICTLQPRFVKVWSFQAWNLAWNISVLTQTFKERWNWVYNGIKLLRDEGIKYNPKAISLYRELGWIFFFKMGDFMDDYHLGYKRQWAWDMYRVLGEPPPDMLAEGVEFQVQQIMASKAPPAEATPRRPRAATAEQAEKWDDKSVQRVIDWFAHIADAPTSWEALVGDPAMASFAQRCEQAGIHLRTRPVGGAVLNVVGEPEVNTTFFDEYQSILSPSFRQQYDLQIGKMVLSSDAKALHDLLNDAQSKPQMDRLLAFMRRYVLANVYKMDPAWMLKLMQRFGPIDWRLPDAHGMYWGSFGVKQVEELGLKDVEEFFGPNTSLNTDRMMMFALQRITFTGRVFFEPNIDKIENSVLDVLPDLRFVNATHKAYVTTASKYDPQAGQIAGEDFRDGHQNYLRDAIRFFYLYGQKDIAGYYYEYLRTKYRLRDGNINEEYMVPLEDFVRDPEFTERLSDPRVAIDAITSYIYQAMRFLVMGDRNTANGLLRYAKDNLYEYYWQKHSDMPQERMKLPPFEVIFNDAAKGYLLAGSGQELLFVKARLWKALPTQTQVAIYDDVVLAIGPQATALGRQGDMDSLFPPPPGMEQHRQQVGGETGGQQERQLDGRIEQRPQDGQSNEELKKRARQGERDKTLNRPRGGGIPQPEGRQ
jgi:hypothetical protein